MPSSIPQLPDCTGVGDVLSRIGDKWSVQVVVVLCRRAERFGSLKRGVPGISQQMLTRTLRNLERDGLIERTVHATRPPSVEYALTPLGISLAEPVHALATWAVAHRTGIWDSRLRFDLTDRDDALNAVASS